MKNQEQDYLVKLGINLPKDLALTKEDWKDFYFTLACFKERVLRRHQLLACPNCKGHVAICGVCGATLTK